MMRKLYLYKNRERLEKGIAGMHSVCIIDVDNGLKADCFDKEIFEKEYVDFISKLGEENNSLYWWAGAISEKNSFSSKLFIRIYKLLSLNIEINEAGDRDIALICSDNVMREQIIFNYKSDFEMKISYMSIFLNNIAKLMLALTGVLRQIKRAFKEYESVLLARHILTDKKDMLKENNNYTVISTTADHRNYKDGSYKDSYFKSLPDFISKKGTNVLTVCRILSNCRELLFHLKDEKDNLIVPVWLYLKGRDILDCLLAAFFKRPVLKGRVLFDRYDITYLVRAESLQDISHCSFLGALFQYYSCKRLAEELSIGRFIYTFENYSWEKTGILGLRSTGRDIKVVGFQHAFVSRNSFKYLPGEHEENIMPFPDKIITMGNCTKNIMDRLGSYPDGIFSAGCALRQEYLSNVEVLPRNVSGNIFVPLTVTIEDSIKVFTFLFDAGLAERPVKIYFRFHPATPVKRVIDGLGFPLPDNFIISENPSIEEELKRCSVVLYTWTTVCLEALKMGRPAIYLDVNFPLEVDPLFECRYLKDECREPGELINKIDRILKVDDLSFQEEHKMAMEYIDEYFLPVNEENLNVFAKC